MQICFSRRRQIDKKSHRPRDNVAELSEVLQNLRASEFKDTRLIGYKVRGSEVRGVRGQGSGLSGQGHVNTICYFVCLFSALTLLFQRIEMPDDFLLTIRNTSNFVTLRTEG